MDEQEEFSEVFVGLVTAGLVIEITLGLVFNISVLVVGKGRVAGSSERGNTFLASLSVVDIVACLSALPLTLVNTRVSRYHGDLLLCLFLEGAVAWSSTASSLTLLLISLERYQAVTKPTHRGMLSSRPTLFLMIVWGLSLFTFSAPFYVLNFDLWKGKLGYDDSGFDSTMMSEVWTSSSNSTTASPDLNTVEISTNSNSDATTFTTNKAFTDISLDLSNATNDIPTSNSSDNSSDNVTNVASPSADGQCSQVVTCDCVLSSTRFFRVYEVVYLAAFFCTSLAMTMFCLAIVRVVRRRVAAKEAAATRQTNMLSATASTSRGGGKPELAGKVITSLKTVTILDMPNTSTSTPGVSEERDMETEGVGSELEACLSPHTLSPLTLGSIQGQGVVRHVAPMLPSQTQLRNSTLFVVSSQAQQHIQQRSSGLDEAAFQQQDSAPTRQLQASLWDDATSQRQASVLDDATCQQEPSILRDACASFRLNNVYAAEELIGGVQVSTHTPRSRDASDIKRQTSTSNKRNNGAHFQEKDIHRQPKYAGIQQNKGHTQQNVAFNPLVHEAIGTVNSVGGYVQKGITQNKNASNIRKNTFLHKVSFSLHRPKPSASPPPTNEQNVLVEETWVQRQQQRQLKRQRRRRRLGRQEEGGPANPSVSASMAQERKVLRVSLGISSVFLFCWGPHMIITLLQLAVQMDSVIENVHIVSLLLAYCTVVIHPLIYAFSRKQFREAISRPWRRYRVRRKTHAAVLMGRPTPGR